MAKAEDRGSYPPPHDRPLFEEEFIDIVPWNPLPYIINNNNNYYSTPKLETMIIFLYLAFPPKNLN